MRHRAVALRSDAGLWLQNLVAEWSAIDGAAAAVAHVILMMAKSPWMSSWRDANTGVGPGNAQKQLPSEGDGGHIWRCVAGHFAFEYRAVTLRVRDVMHSSVD
jgi:hypothetical protein